MSDEGGEIRYERKKMSDEQGMMIRDE